MEDTNRDRRDQARWIILLATLAGAMYLCWLMLKPFIGVLLWAAVLTMSFEPVHRRLLERTRRPNLSAALSCTLVVLAIGVPVGLLTWAIIHELAPALRGVEAGLIDLLSPHSPITGPVVEWLAEHVDVDIEKVQLEPEDAKAMSQQIAALTADQRGDQMARLERSMLRLERVNLQTLAILKKLVEATQRPDKGGA